MNHYYANGSIIFEPPSILKDNQPEPRYGSAGHLTNHLYKYQIKVKYKINPNHSHMIDMTLTAPDGDLLFIDGREHNNMRADVYLWSIRHGKKPLDWTQGK